MKLLFRTIKSTLGFVPESMYKMQKSPALLSAFTTLSGIIISNEKKINPIAGARISLSGMLHARKHLKNKNRVPVHLRSLIGYITSNSAGCRYCQAHTITEAKNNGATERQLREIWNFDNSDAFNDAEKAALTFAVAAGSFPNATTKEDFKNLSQYYSEEQIVEIVSVISLFGFLNKWNDTFATPLENKPFETAKEYLGDSGWEIGKHGS